MSEFRLRKWRETETAVAAKKRWWIEIEKWTWRFVVVFIKKILP